MGDQAANGQFSPAVPKTAGACNPKDDLQIAQTARGFLKIWL